MSIIGGSPMQPVQSVGNIISNTFHEAALNARLHFGYKPVTAESAAEALLALNRLQAAHLGERRSPLTTPADRMRAITPLILLNKNVTPLGAQPLTISDFGKRSAEMYTLHGQTHTHDGLISGALVFQYGTETDSPTYESVILNETSTDFDARDLATSRVAACIGREAMANRNVVAVFTVYDERGRNTQKRLALLLDKNMEHAPARAYELYDISDAVATRVPVLQDRTNSVHNIQGLGLLTISDHLMTPVRFKPLSGKPTLLVSQLLRLVTNDSSVEGS